MPANRALAPSSKLAASRWVSQDVLIDGLPATTDDACYRAMDWPLQIKDPLEKEIFEQVANLLNLEVNLLFFDTTPSYFEPDDEDEPVPRDSRGRVAASEEDADGKPAGFRACGKSKDHRDDLPQVVIGMAVTGDGIPVRVWRRPGNTSDSALIRQVKDDMRDWALAKIVWVAGRGFTSAENRRYLRKGSHHYIIGEKLRSGSAETAAIVPAGPLSGGGGEPASQGGPHRRGRAVHHLLQPRRRRAGRRRPRPDAGAARRADQGF